MTNLNTKANTLHILVSVDEIHLTTLYIKTNTLCILAGFSGTQFAKSLYIGTNTLLILVDLDGIQFWTLYINANTLLTLVGVDGI